VPEEEFLREDAAGGVDADGAVIFPVLQSGCHVREEGCAVDFVLVAGLPEVACVLVSWFGCDCRSFLV